MSNLVQFVFVRTDMASMTRGRIAAQCMHAANQMVYDIENATSNKSKVLLEEWQKEAGGFGTTFVMDAKNAQTLAGIISGLSAFVGCDTGNITDPTYPVQDGEVTHLIEVITCGYAFGNKEDIMPLLKEMNIDFLRDKE